MTGVGSLPAPVSLRTSAPPLALAAAALAMGMLKQAVWSLGGFTRARPGAAETPEATGHPPFEAAALPHLDAAYNLARYLCRDPDVAEDIVQEAYLRAFRGWPGFRGGNVRAWLLAIVRNCHLTWRDQARRTGAPAMQGAPQGDDAAEEDTVLGIPAEGDPETDLLRRDEDHQVREILALLPEDAREVLVLRDIEDCSYREIADILALPIGTVMSRLSRARRAFAARWQQAQKGTAR